MQIEGQFTYKLYGISQKYPLGRDDASQNLNKYIKTDVFAADWAAVRT